MITQIQIEKAQNYKRYQSNQQKIFGLQIQKPPSVMSVVPGRSESPPYTYSNPTNKFARIDNNPNLRNAQYYSPYVHGSQALKNPDFYKSPLTSVQIYRKNRSRAMPLNEGSSHIVEQAPTGQGCCHVCNWKQILCWALIALALLGLAIGLFFLIRSLLMKNDNSHRAYTYTVPDVAPAPTYTGINPVYVSPVPYSTMQVPTVSGYFESPTEDRYNYVTAPQTSQNSLRKEGSSTDTTPNPVTQPTVSWIPDPANSYVNPLDVYTRPQY